MGTGMAWLRPTNNEYQLTYSRGFALQKLSPIGVKEQYKINYIIICTHTFPKKDIHSRNT